MGFGEAVKTVLSKYADFSGRARRSEYWYFTLFLVVASFVAALVDLAIGVPLLQVLVLLGTLVPSIAVTVRRLHDTGRSGWLYLIVFIPIVGVIVLLVFLCQDSKPEPNQWGPSPKHGGGMPGYAPQGYPQPGV